MPWLCQPHELPVVLYLASLLLLLTILALTAISKFALARQVLLVLAFALYAISGPVILAVPARQTHEWEKFHGLTLYPKNSSHFACLL